MYIYMYMYMYICIYIYKERLHTNYDIHSLWQPPHSFFHHEDGVDVSGDDRHDWRVHRRSPKDADLSSCRLGRRGWG